MMTLKRFQVTNFRSIMDSGWIDCDNVTSLVGINEAGKSNVILALWKLKPVRDGEIDLLHDMPTKEYSSWRTTPEDIVFISADFELDNALINKVVALCKCDREAATIVNIKRRYNGEYDVSFPNYKRAKSINISSIVDAISVLNNQLKELKEKTKAEAGIKASVSTFYDNILTFILSKEVLTQADFAEIKKMYPIGLTQSARSEIFPNFQAAQTVINNGFSDLNPTNPADNTDIRKWMISEMPSFVYYSNYGNLDTQIYLPHAIKWLNSEKVEGIDNNAKVRTLRVLFDFVKLNPQEVLDLGKDPVKVVVDNYGRESKKAPTAEEIEKATEQKAARAILLNSASTDLTRKFKEWWKQGNYIFRFQADGEFFKIWVSDDKRPEEIELERRSTGLQWFLSFYLTFLVESQEAHKGAILLLDEAGLSLHPLAQKDLIAFFESLSETNQLIYTTHSPFLVDTSNIDRAKVVYSDDNGLTVVSSDLRASDDKLNEKSIYAVHAALGLSVSDILLQGCQPIIVEGPSDQHYFNAIKLYLIRNKKYAPNMELVFIPSGGVRGVAGVVSIVGGKDGTLPLVILDGDSSGKSAMNKLQSGLYQHCDDAILNIGDFLDFENGEIEDLIPPRLMFRQIDRLFRDVEDESFEDVFSDGQAIIPQIEQFAKRHSIQLSKGWKVDVAKGVKQQLQKGNSNIVPDEYIGKWRRLFEKFNS
ncbi:MAG: ATP-binding protein [Lachnospiraceae bacterium]|nr:ATP-binding protein [Lachnospiraceae bacterium]